jgi:hypothetical protein
MYITLSPQRRDDSLTLRRDGDSLTLNGETYDFSAVPDGGALTKAQAGCPWLAGDVTRTGGELRLSLILPHGPDAPPETLFPAPLRIETDGTVSLPPANRPVPPAPEDDSGAF